RGIAADLAEERDLVLGPLANSRALMDTERPRLIFARSQNLHHQRSRAETLAQGAIEVRVSLFQYDGQRRLHGPSDQRAGTGQRNRAGVLFADFAIGRSVRKTRARKLHSLVDRMKQPRPV